MSPDFQQQQRAFTACIRNPDNPPPQGIEARRMALYAELFYNGLNDQLSGIFPVLRSLTDDQRWEAILRDYLIRHRARTPLFPQIGMEFVDYLNQERESDPDDPPYMAELAHYEYVDLAVAVSDADQDHQPAYDPNGDLLSGCPVVAPTAWNLTYGYPVHNIGPDNPTPDPTQTHLVVYRDRQDLVHCLEINPVTQRLLMLIEQAPQASGEALLLRIADELQHPEPELVVQHGSDLLHDLRQRNVVLGSRPARP